MVLYIQLIQVSLLLFYFSSNLLVWKPLCPWFFFHSQNKNLYIWFHGSDLSWENLQKKFAFSQWNMISEIGIHTLLSKLMIYSSWLNIDINNLNLRVSWGILDLLWPEMVLTLSSTWLRGALLFVLLPRLSWWKWYAHFFYHLFVVNNDESWESGLHILIVLFIRM